MGDTIRIASFDIGKKNFAQYVEDVSLGVINSQKKFYNDLPVKNRRRVKGQMNTDVENILKALYEDGKRIHIGVFDFRDDKESLKLDMPTRKNILKHLVSFKWLWDTCDAFVIEQQYFHAYSPGKKTRGTEANVDAIKIGEAVLFWFLHEYPFKSVQYIGSQLKTQILGAPYKMNKAQRKKWAEEKAREIYEMRNDADALELYALQERIFRKRLTNEEKIQEYIDSFNGQGEDVKYLANKLVRERQKLDDVADACIQCQAYKYRYLVACF